MFRKFISFIAIAVFATATWASEDRTTLDTKGLTPAQIAEIKAITAKKVAESAASVGTSPDNITTGVALAATWGNQAAQAAEGFAKAMGIAARELNVTINDFLTSPAGIITAALIIWKVAGASLLSALYGVLFLIVGLTMVRVIYVRLFTKGYEKVEYSRFGGFIKGTRMVRIPKSVDDLESDGEWMVFWVMIILTVATLLFGGVFF